MKIFPIYEFPKADELKIIMDFIDQNQPVEYEKLFDVIGDTIIKANSRTKITLNTLKKVGFIEGNRLIALSSATQIYLDLNKSLKELLLYLIYLKKDLFNDCKTIYRLIEGSKDNIDIIQELWNIGYTDSKRTAQEKVYAIKRLITLCQDNENHNPFKEYEDYISFLIKLQEYYFKLAKDQKNHPVTIISFKKTMLESSVSEKEFDHYFLRLYNDPIFAINTSFTTVILEFANEKYYRIGDKEFYYFKLSDNII